MVVCAISQKLFWKEHFNDTLLFPFPCTAVFDVSTLQVVILLVTVFICFSLR